MSMREKIAEAIWQAEWKRAGNSGERRVPWQENSDETMNKYRFLADAILDALMEPTEAMMRAGIDNCALSIRQDRAGPRQMTTPFEDECADIFHAMIRAAKEGK